MLRVLTEPTPPNKLSWDQVGTQKCFLEIIFDILSDLSQTFMDVWTFLPLLNPTLRDTSQRFYTSVLAVIFNLFEGVGL